jgi:hypothetical protein
VAVVSSLGALAVATALGATADLDPDAESRGFSGKKKPRDQRKAFSWFILSSTS